MSSEKKKKVRGLWSEENMKKAVAVLLTGQLSLKMASKVFEIPVATLRRRISDIKAGKEVSFAPAMGRFKPTFSKELEEQLVMYVKTLDRELKPFKRDDFLKLSYDLACHLNLPHQFNSQQKSAGRKFYYDFMKRHPDLFPQKRDYSASRIAAEYLESLNPIEPEIEISVSSDSDSGITKPSSTSIDKNNECLQSSKDTESELEAPINIDSNLQITKQNTTSTDKNDQNDKSISITVTKKKKTDVRPV